jgi:hypothetical protein
MRRTPFNSLSFVSSFRRSSVTAAYSFTMIFFTRIVADFSLRPRIKIPEIDIVVLWTGIGVEDVRK